MIVNVPTSEDLERTSLRLYFKAWSEVANVITEWLEYSGLLDSDGRWEDYVKGAQSDLQGIYTLIQQSQEIGLKALIAEVSPFLLLKKHEASPLQRNGSEYDFTDFPTHDAANLIRIHDTFCDRKISESFVRHYDEIRRARNKISHLGIFDLSLDPVAMVEVLVEQYAEFYASRSWMKDRLDYAALHRWASLIDASDHEWNDRTSLLSDLWQLLPVISEEAFEFLMKHPRSERRYICFHCTTEANLGAREPYADDIPTAYEVPGADAVRCVVCEETYQCARRPCSRDECDGPLISAEPDSRDECHTCGRRGADDDRFVDGPFIVTGRL